MSAGGYITNVQHATHTFNTYSLLCTTNHATLNTHSEHMFDMNTHTYKFRIYCSIAHSYIRTHTHTHLKVRIQCNKSCRSEGEREEETERVPEPELGEHQ